MTEGTSTGNPCPPARARLGIGLDAEQVERFQKFAAGERPWRLVYSEREAGHLAAQAQAARAFCAAFCCKEAFYKALGEFYAFPEFECLYTPGAAARFVLSPGLEGRRGVEDLRVNIDERFLDERGELVVELYLIRPALSHRESTQVAAVAAERLRIEEEHFSAREIADLGTRRVQSLAGFLALKQALVGLWSAAGAGAAKPRDFELGHHASGAPRLLAAPPGLALPEVFVSISHTRQWAYGLAAAGR